MTPDEFQKVIEKIRPYTNYIYLHVLGEPLLHPKFEEILSIAENALLNINITTNGGLIEKKKGNSFTAFHTSDQHLTTRCRRKCSS